MQPRQILFLGMSPLAAKSQGVYNRSFAVLDEMISDPSIERIFYLDPQPFNLRTRLRSRLAKRAAVPSTAKLIHLPGTRSLAQLRTLLTQLIASNEASNFTLWSYNPFLQSLLSEFNGTTVFDTVDNWIAHPSYRRATRKLTTGYRAIAERSQAIFTVSEPLVAWYDQQWQRRARVWCVPNAVNLSHWSAPQPVPPELVRVAQPRVLYCGVIDGQRLDLDLIESLVRARPQYQFLFIGPIWPIRFRSLRPKAPIRKRLARYPNVHMLGGKPYAMLPSYFAQCDAGIIPHRKTALTQSMDPLKCYEYLAAGLPVVATDVTLPPSLKPYVTVATAPGDFLTALDRAIQSNSAAQKLQRQNALREHTWAARWHEMKRLLQWEQL